MSELRSIRRAAKIPVFATMEAANIGLAHLLRGILKLLHASVLKNTTLPLAGRAASVFGLKPGDAILVIAAHPDDETAGMGATMAALAADGIEIHVALITDGRDSRSTALKDLPKADRGRMRMAECRQALAALDPAIQLHGRFLSAGEDWEQGARFEPILDEVAKLARATRPLAVFTLPSFDFHPDHRAAAHLAEQVRSQMSAPPQMFHYEVQGPFRPFAPTHWVEADRESTARKAEAIRAYRSQRGNSIGPARLSRLRRALAGARGEVEAFAAADSLVVESDLRRGFSQRPFLDWCVLLRWI